MPFQGIGKMKMVAENGTELDPIPACAGGTTDKPKNLPLLSVLPPRMLGNLGQRDQLGLRHGPIPACAGEPTFHQQTAHTRRDYPRVCRGTPAAQG